MDSSLGLGRRAFVATSLATGFALAVRPVSAQTITTDAKGLVAGDVSIDGMPAYRAMPEGAGKFPLVLVVQEIFGVHEHIKDVCRRLAKAGYLAVAPELFARQADVSKMEMSEIVSKVVPKVPDDQVMRDLDATANWAKKSGKVDGDRVGITGFCWGGRIAWLYAAHTPAPRAAVAWYGKLSNATNTLQTSSVMDVAPRLKAPVLGLYGELDGSIPLGQIEQMKKELADPKASKAAAASEFVVYPGAGHAFNADYRPSYKKDAAEDGWKRMLAWFKKNGV